MRISPKQLAVLLQLIKFNANVEEAVFASSTNNFYLFIYLFQVTTIIWNILNKLLQTTHNKKTFNIKCYFLISFAFQF